MRLDALHPGVTRDQVREQTGVSPARSDRGVRHRAAAADELAMLRALDPERRFLG